MEYKIEKGIAVSQAKRGKWIALVNNMDIGDCVTLNDLNEVSGIRMAMDRLGFKAVTRRNLDRSQIRVWKMSDE